MMKINKIFLLIHSVYFSLSILMMNKIMFLYNVRRNNYPAELIEILSWLSKDYYYYFVTLISVISTISLISSVVKPSSKLIRTLVFISVLLVNAIDSSYGHVEHAYYGWLTTTFIFIFLPDIKKADDYLNRKKQVLSIIFLAQFSSIICYAMAGIWKARYLFENLYQGDNEKILYSLSNPIAFQHIRYGIEMNQFSLFLINHLYFSTSLFIVLVCIQLLSPIIIFFGRLHVLFALVIFIFHLSSEIILKISFRPQMYLILLLFLFSPFKQPFFKINISKRCKTKEKANKQFV